MVAEDGQGVGCQSTGGHMKDGRPKLSSYFVHIGNHQQEPLRGRKCGRQCPCRQSAVDGSSRPGFRLQFSHAQGLPPHVLTTIGGPLVCDLPHV